VSGNEIDSAEKPKNASTKLSMNGKSPMVSIAPPFVLRGSRRMNGEFFSRIEGRRMKTKREEKREATWRR
jgi:hypothetical protein